MTFTKISVLVPTRHRVTRLRTLLDSYKATCGDRDSELVFRVDEDDRDTSTFLCQRGYIPLVGPRMSGYGSVPVFFDELRAKATGDVLMLGNDDMLFRTKDWAKELLTVANHYPNGLFDLGVSTHNEDHYPFSIVSAKAVQAIGGFCDPRVFWVDMFLRDVMAAFGRCVMVPFVRIDHDWAGNAPDDVYREGLSHKAAVEQDVTYGTMRHQVAVDSAVAKLQGCYAS
jgi:hypothetical protein